MTDELVERVLGDMEARLDSRLPTRGSGVPKPLARSRRVYHNIVLDELEVCLRALSEEPKV